MLAGLVDQHTQGWGPDLEELRRRSGARHGRKPVGVPMRNRSTISHILVTCTSAIVIVAWPFFTQPADRLRWLGISAWPDRRLYTLAHNKLGNFGIYPEPIPDACR